MYGWSGDFCDQIVCHYGWPDATNTKCVCNIRYTGRFCDACADPASSPAPDCTPAIRKYANSEYAADDAEFQQTSKIIIICVIVLLKIVFCALCYGCIQSRKESNQRKRATYLAMKKGANR